MIEIIAFLIALALIAVVAVLITLGVLGVLDWIEDRRVTEQQHRWRNEQYFNEVYIAELADEEEEKWT